MRLLEILDKNAVKSLAMEMTAKLLFQELGRLANPHTELNQPRRVPRLRSGKTTFRPHLAKV